MPLSSRSDDTDEQVLAVVMSETAGTTALKPGIGDHPEDRSLTSFKYQDNVVYTNVRRFVVVRAKREFAYAWSVESSLQYRVL